ncbi:hypothetical protein [Bacterioplanes sanyensis]|uniref:hypothetical protein n=1 Tax=Bacterioplanes sanyensis TaxID=1249553 RepID=UPI0012FDAFCD|nr:hypothetical protein [Bacterioplanes sanyensis]
MNPLFAEPSAIDDEAFLLFLADSEDHEGEVIDPLSMIPADGEHDENHDASDDVSEQHTTTTHSNEEASHVE